MGYQALLFCPDEKTARTVTQVLGELEFDVEACAEPFAAVKKLMGQHFDAVVVDCDNEQNATLLFKSARNSASNQASLAVAVVEGQAGVAKAFRIGANLVLTKPINIEQAKGTLRVARGLLRKGDPAKPAVPAAAPPATHAPSVAPTAAAPTKPVAVKPVLPTKPAVPVAPRTLSAAIANPRPIAPPVVKPAPTPVAPATAAASTIKSASPAPSVKVPVVSAPVAKAPVANDDDLLDIADESKPVTSTTKFSAAVKPMVSAAAPAVFSGAASAPAPARAVQDSHLAALAPEPAFEAVEDEAIFDKPAEVAPIESIRPIATEPTFTFGGANVPEPSSGGSKKIFLGVAAAVLVAAAGYYGWTTLQASKSGMNRPAPVSVPQVAKPATIPAAPSAIAPSATTTTPDITLSTVPDSSAKPPASSSALPTNSAAPSSVDTPVAATPVSAGPNSATPTSTSPAGSKKTAPAKLAAPALVVKGGTAPALQAKSTDPDTPAPSIVATGDSSALPNLGSSSPAAAKPVLQALTISQGVSQGLLLKKIQPFYPKSAIAAQIEGSVALMATISKTGDISHVTVLSGDPQLSKAAADAVKQWKYKPYLLNGEPVEIQTQVTINFKLPK